MICTFPLLSPLKIGEANLLLAKLEIGIPINTNNNIITLIFISSIFYWLQRYRKKKQIYVKETDYSISVAKEQISISSY